MDGKTDLMRRPRQELRTLNINNLNSEFPMSCMKNINRKSSLPATMFLVLSYILLHVMLLVSAKKPQPYVPKDIIVIIEQPRIDNQVDMLDTRNQRQDTRESKDSQHRILLRIFHLTFQKISLHNYRFCQICNYSLFA